MSNFTGQTFKGYEFQKRLGAGGFGEVYQAFQPVIKREVAVKVILPQYASKPDFIRRFEVEAELIARLEHPFIVPLFDYWREPDGAFLVLRFLRGGSLTDALKEGAWSMEDTANLLDQIAGALNVAHRNNVIHRDIKPDNILLDEDRNAYLTDFGIATDVTEEQRTEGIVGTPAYMSPEQITGRAVSPRTDIYSMGIVIYEMLTGRLPFVGTDSSSLIMSHLNSEVPDLREVKSDLPDRLNDVIQRATAKEPLNRFENMRDFARTFRSAIARSQDFDFGGPVPGGNDASKRTLTLTLDDLVGADEEVNVTMSGDVPDTLVFSLDDEEELGEVRITRHDSLEPLTMQMDELPDDVKITRTGKTSRKLRITGEMLLSDMEFEEQQIKNPYKGLRPFTEADSADFFGRSALISRLLERLKAPESEYERFLAVVGASGSGKSSAVRAGLLPALRRGELPGSNRWFITDMVPAGEPLKNLETAILSVAFEVPDDFGQRLRADVSGLHELLVEMFSEYDDELLLLVDQFEEAFTQVEAEKDRAFFLDALRHAIMHPESRLRVIVTMRADFTDRPLQYVEFGEMMRQRMEFVLPLSAAELEESITGPAERVGLEVEGALVAAIVADVQQEPGALPLLQYALTELFERREGRTITHEAYQQSGGVLGALARRAEEVYTEMKPDDQAMLRQIFLRLVTLGEGNDDTRRRARRSELAALGEVEEVDAVLNEFGQYRLLSFDVDSVTREPTIEVAHEALIREWQRLREWLDHNRADIRLQRMLGTQATEWQESNQDNSFLLRGSRLAQYTEWMQRTDLILSPAEKSFLEASIAERDRLEREEKERQERELQTQRELAEQRQKAAQRMQMIVAGLAVFLVIAVVLTIFAFNQRQEAEEQRESAVQSEAEAQSQRRLADRRADEAQSIALGAGAQQVLEDNTLLALALAYEANQIDDPPVVARQILARAAYRPGARQDYEGHTDTVNAVALSPDGETLLSGGRDNRMLHFDVESGELIREFDAHTGWVNAVVFLAEGEEAISASDDATLIRWNLANGDILHTYEAHTDFIDALAISPDESLLASGGGDDTVYLWDLESGDILHEMGDIYNDEVGDIFITALAFSPDGAWLMVAYESPFDGEGLFLYEVATGELLYEYFGEFAFVTSIAFMVDNERVLTGTFDRQIIMWDIESQEVIYTFAEFHTDAIWSIALSDDETQLVSGSDDRSVILWEVESGLPQQIFTGHRDFVPTVDMHDEMQIISGSADQSVLLWENRVGNIQRIFDAHDEAVNGLALASDGDTLITASDDGTLSVWDVESGEPRLSLEGHTAPVQEVAISPDGAMAASASNDGSVILWDVESGDLIQRLEGHAGVVYAVAFSLSGDTLLSGGEDNRMLRWNVESGEMIGEYAAHTEYVSSVAFSPDGSQALSGSLDGSMILWDVESGDILQEFFGHVLLVTDVAFTPDGAFGLSASADTTIVVWDLATGEEVRRLEGHTDWVRALNISPDGQRLVSASYDGTLIVWQMESGLLLVRFEGHEFFVQDVTFNPAGDRLYSADVAGRVFEWRIDDLAALLNWTDANRYIRPFTCEEEVSYFLPRSPECVD